MKTAAKTPRVGADIGVLETQQGISFIKRDFQDRLAEPLGLCRVSSPLYVDAASGVQDNLSGHERPVAFEAHGIKGPRFEIVHSLAKWKRQALADYGFPCGKGLYTDMNALRPDEEDLTTRIHSIYVDQWDWEKAITAEDRTRDFLEATVRTIYGALKDSEAAVEAELGLAPTLPDEITFIHTEELLARWPEASRKEREDRICEELGAVFLVGIGGELSDGESHDGRAPDYDDWTTETPDGYRGLNGDITVWNQVLSRSFELSSMGIRVDRDALIRQLEIRDCCERAELPWHRRLLAGELPECIGGGIGQSRICMLLLQKRHVGEVQVSAWPEEVLRECRAEGISLL